MRKPTDPLSPADKQALDQEAQRLVQASAFWQHCPLSYEAAYDLALAGMATRAALDFARSVAELNPEAGAMVTRIENMLRK